MIQANDKLVRAQNKVKVYRWYYYLALTQLLLYFIVPALIFPSRVIKDVETISAMTLGLLVGIFFLLVSLLGLFLDAERRRLYIASSLVIVVYFSAALVAWSYIEHLDFLLR